MPDETKPQAKPAAPAPKPDTMSPICRDCITPGDSPDGRCYMRGRAGITHCDRRTFVPPTPRPKPDKS